MMRLPDAVTSAYERMAAPSGGVASSGKRVRPDQRISSSVAAQESIISGPCSLTVTQGYAVAPVELAGVMPSDTVAAVKLRVHEVTQIPVKHQRLVFGGRELSDPDMT